MYEKDPSLAMVHPFGCLAYTVNLSPHKSKFDSRSLKCVFLGYAVNQKGFLLYDMDNSQVITARDVKFIHSTYPFSSISTPDTSTLPLIPIPYNNESSQSDVVVDFENISPIDSPISSSPANSSPLDSHVHPPSLHISPPIRKSSRTIKPPIWMSDYVGDVDPHTSHFAGSSSTTTPPTFPYQTPPHFSTEYTAFLLNITNIHEPTSYREASTSLEWATAMDQEIAALESNNTWELTDLPPGKRPIGCKWVYKVKLLADGSVERFKARLVAKGYNQEYGIDYTEVFSPVAKLVTVRFLIALATTYDWAIHQIDVNNAFLHGFLHDEIYMSPPQGYKKAKPGQVCKLVKSLYGLKQASREWNAEFCTCLFRFGFVQSSHDHCLFIKGTGSDFLCLIVYVDDILITGPNESLISELKHYLDTAFTIKDLGLAKYFLGMEIIRGNSGTSLNQRKYILDLLDTMGLIGCRSTNTPFPQGLVLSSTGSSPLVNPDSYRQLVGKLLYLNLTRPDITYAVQQLSQFVSKPCQHHWDAALHVLKYLKGCPSLGLFYPARGSVSIRAYSDADWGSCSDTRRSLTGFCVFLGDCLISWKCKKQSTVSVSSAEAEYRALSATVRELMWLHFLCSDFGVSVSLPLPLYCDNQAAIHITKNQVFHERTKHLDIDCHLVRDQFRSGFITPVHVSTTVQLADLLTKALPGPRFRFLLSKLGLVDLHCVQLAGG